LVAGVTALSFHENAPISITNDGTIQNLSGASSDLAIRSYGGPATIINNGTITGVVNLLNPDSNSFTNNGIWNTAGGTNPFGGSDTLTNTSTGVINAANSGATSPVTTTFNGLSTFTNAGQILMHNGVVGNQPVINGNFVGQGGSMAIDTYLNDSTSPTDFVQINGSATGSTQLFVYNAKGWGHFRARRADDREWHPGC
jgi:hypothetical protein